MNRRQMLTGALAGLATAALSLFVPIAPNPKLRDLYLLTKNRTILKKVRMAQLKVGDSFLCFEGKELLGTFTCIEAPRKTFSAGSFTQTVTVETV
jgi:hypothetical protein